MTSAYQSAAITSPGWLLGSLMVLVGLSIITTIVISFLTRTQPADAAGVGVTRALMSLVLVGGLVLLTGAAFDDPRNADTRNLLVGGVVASASSAVAFYFASRGAQEARQDILKAAFGTEIVPTLVGLTASEAHAAISATSLTLQLPDPAPSTGTISSQTISPGTSVPKGTVISVAF